MLHDAPARPPRFEAIQMARGLAAVLVVCCHAVIALPLYRDHPDGAVRNLLSALLPLSFGVDIFFVVSGFVMMMIVRSAGAPSAGAFMANRALRIYPPYWVVVLILLLAVSVGSFPELAGRATGVPVLLSALLLPQAGEPLLFVSWTLTHELVFYLIIAAILAAGLRRHALAVMVGLSVIASVLALAGWRIGYGFVAPPCWIEFTAGMALFQFRAWFHRLAGGTMLVGGVLLFLLVATTGERGPQTIFGNGAAAALLVAGLVALDTGVPSGSAHTGLGRLRPALLFIGDASYSIYLTHPIWLRLPAELSYRFPATAVNHWAAWILGSLLLAIGGGILYARTIEFPLLALSRSARSHPLKGFMPSRAS